MRVIVGPLAKSGLESRVGPDLPAAVNAALVYYVGRLSSGRGPVKFPKFLAMQVDQVSGARQSEDGSPENIHRPEVEVDVDERVEAAICTDARLQGVCPAELAGHAVLAYLAEHDLLAGTITPSPGPSPPDRGR